MSTNLVELTIQQPDSELFERAQLQLTEAQASVIASPVQFDAAGEELKAIKGLQKSLEEKRTAITRPLNEALKQVNDLFRPAKEWLEKAEGLRKDKMIGWRSEQARIAREQQERLEAAARKEREAIEAKAREAERKAQEKAAVALAAAKNAEELAAVEKRNAQKLAEAEAKAAALRATAAQVAAPKVVADLPKMSGQSVRDTWTYEVVDLTAVPREFLMLDEKKLGTIVRAMKGTTNIPGIKVLRGETISSGSL